MQNLQILLSDVSGYFYMPMVPVLETLKDRIYFFKETISLDRILLDEFVVLGLEISLLLP